MISRHVSNRFFLSVGIAQQKGDVVSVGSELPRYRAPRENVARAPAT
jgi:hypothetical protein